MTDMPHNSQFAPMPKTLDRQAWHNPLVSIVVTHHNYSGHIEDALLSVLDQTYTNWECVIIDDGSDAQHLRAVEAIIGKIGSEKIRLICRGENLGQIPAFFHGLDATTGPFACLLDPDDRYGETFLAELIAAHLNEVLYCPIACADQYLLAGGAVFTGCYIRHKKHLLGIDRRMAEVPHSVEPKLLFFPATMKGWPWSSTSAMMFRRAALNYLRPHKLLAYKGSADSYLAHGAHMLGGSLVLTKPLVYRSIHDNNAYLTQDVFTMGQDLKKAGVIQRGPECIIDVTEAIKANGGGWNETGSKQTKRTLPHRLRRSIAKRWRRLTQGGQ
jgi:glycosyltransferase involved in cell wall biosynthesis